MPFKGIEGKMGSNLTPDTLRWLTEQNKWFKGNGRPQTIIIKEDVKLPMSLWHKTVWFRLQESAKNGDDTALKALEWALKNIKLSNARNNLIENDFQWEVHLKRR